MENTKPSSPVKKKQQQHQLRALLFNRLGLFTLGAEAKTTQDNGEPSIVAGETGTATNRQLHAQPGVCSQQYLKGDSASSTSNNNNNNNNNNKGGEPQKRGGLIRFNSIVSVVAIPSRIQYSNSMRNILWGSKKGRQNGGGGSFHDEDLDSTAGTQDDPVVPTPKRVSKSKKTTTGRHRLMRKQSFHK